MPGIRTVLVRRPVVLRVARRPPAPADTDSPRLEAVTRNGPTFLDLRKNNAMIRPSVVKPGMVATAMMADRCDRRTERRASGPSPATVQGDQLSAQTRGSSNQNTVVPGCDS